MEYIQYNFLGRTNIDPTHISKKDSGNSESALFDTLSCTMTAPSLQIEVCQVTMTVMIKNEHTAEQ